MHECSMENVPADRTREDEKVKMKSKGLNGFPAVAFPEDFSQFVVTIFGFKGSSFGIC